MQIRIGQAARRPCHRWRMDAPPSSVVWGCGDASVSPEVQHMVLRSHQSRICGFACLELDNSKTYSKIVVQKDV